jgi:hypothetical protein
MRYVFAYRLVVAMLLLAGGLITRTGLTAEPELDRSTEHGQAGVKIPKTWDPERLKGLELPLAGLGKSPELISPEYYYRVRIRPIYKSYDVFHPDQEPAGYFEWLMNQEPEILWDEFKAPPLESEEDWIRAGEMVFDSPIGFTNGSIAGPYPGISVRDGEWHEHTGAPLMAEGILPFYRYVIREKGRIEVGVLSCAMCHTRVMPDKSVIKGAQGNFPFGKAFAYDYRKNGSPNLARRLERMLYGARGLQPDPLAELDTKTVKEIALAHESVPAGVLTRHGTGVWSPVQVPDLIGVQERRYLDRTGLQRHRDIGDLMRYAALNQGADLLSDFGGFVPGGILDFRGLPEPESRNLDRYSDEQLYALARYIYSLEPPANPHLPKTPEEEILIKRGEHVFREEGCVKCHNPRQGYTNNKLVTAPGFVVPDDHPARGDIMHQRVGTDGTLTLQTRRGTGLYKVPSLRGVWYRSHFEHNGSCLTLEDWFDPRRLEDDYAPTGWKGPGGTKTRAVKGHEYGLDLSEEDKRALLAFLRTL